MDNQIPKTWGRGHLRIHDIEIDCYVLDDGTPILNKKKILKALGRPKKGGKENMPAFIDAKNLQLFVRDELREKLKGIEFYDGGRLFNGYHADILPLICNTYLEAREAGVLTPAQLPIAQTCEILIRSFAKVGITALIYEQLGFEKYKHPDALRMLIESYLAEEVRKWSKEFPDELFYQMDRIYGNEKTTSRNRPQYYALFIRKYIYDPLEKGFVLKRLEEKNPINEKGYRESRFHQFLSETKGITVLRAQIWQIIGLLKASASKRRFEANYERMMGGNYQLEIWEE